MPNEAKGWMKLDNAAKIYPAAMRKKWMAMYRVSMTLSEPVELFFLNEAIKSTIPRFPGFTVKLRRGLFWFYLEQSGELPVIQNDVANPCARMDIRRAKFMFRLRCYDCRIALEVFHVLADGSGSMIFLKTLVAEYLRLKYGAQIPRSADLLDCSEPPKPEETEDSFLRYAGNVVRSRREENAYRIVGTPIPPDDINLTTGMIPVDIILAKAKEKKVSLTEYLTAVLIMSIDTIQRRDIKQERHLKTIKVSVPVNLRAFFPSTTLRNFSYFINPGIEPRLGKYSFDEILSAVHHYLNMEATEKNLGARFNANVRSEQSIALRVVPLVLKNVVMKVVYNRVGDRKTTTTLTNLGRVTLPDEMKKYVTRVDAILGPLSRNPVVAAALSYDNTLYFTFTRNIAEADLEREFFRNLIKLGIPVKIESNRQ